MNGDFLIKALFLISALTSLTVEAIKKLLNGKEIKYSSNLIAAIVSVILTVAISIGYIIYESIEVNPQIVVTIIALIYLSFLSATVGFDKVKQLINQIKG